ncbi:MAG: ABC transporter permease [Desulfobacterales bacterium]|nr:ABC transporter permease [Desulfobacterales bacterium]
MKAIDIALKDMKRSFRSAFAILFMFGIPLLVTGMFYLMFGNTSTAASEPNVVAAPPALPKTRIMLVNLDQGSPELILGLAALGTQAPAGGSLGGMLAAALLTPGANDPIEIVPAADADAAKRAVDSGQAAAALIIPVDFSAAYAAPEGQAVIELYRDPSHAAGAGMAQSTVEQLTEVLSGTKIAVLSAAAQMPAGSDPALLDEAAQQYSAWAVKHSQVGPQAGLVTLRAPASAPVKKESSSVMSQIIGPIMGGMMIFFAFFTAANCANSILKEDEEGTLPRLMTTPTPLRAILGGKFLAVGLTVLVQVSVLLVAANLLFHIQWGDPLSTALTALGIVACASTFGIFLASLLKNTKQAGAVFGGLMTVTGMVGMLGVFAGEELGNSVALTMPQGWAVRGLLLGMRGAALGEVALNLLALLAISALLFAAGTLRFQKRYA